MLVLLAARAAEGVVTPRPVLEEVGPEEYGLGRLEYSCRTSADEDCMGVLETMV